MLTLSFDSNLLPLARSPLTLALLLVRISFPQAPWGFNFWLGHSLFVLLGVKLIYHARQWPT